MNPNAFRAGRVAKQRDIVWISTEGRNIALNPLERLVLIHVGVISISHISACGTQAFVADESKGRQPIIQRDHNNIARESQAGAVVNNNLSRRHLTS